MATYDELYGLRSNSSLRNKIEVALWIAASAISEEDVGTPNHAARLVWAKNTLAGSRSVAENILGFILAKNSGVDVGTIVNATDAAIQTNVNAVINMLALG